MGIDTQAHDSICNKRWLNIENRCNDFTFLDCKHEHMMKSDESCTLCYLSNSMVSQTRLISKGYHSLVPGLMAVF